jgi:hypothetical protein
VKNIARNLGLTDKGTRLNHRCNCGVNTRLGEDADGQIWSWCPKCNCRLNVIFIRRFPKSSLLKFKHHTD